MDAVIVGGGIGGLAVAAGLHRRGWGVTVLEQTAGFDVTGSAISLWPNAFRALNAVGVTGELGERIGVAGGLRDYRGRWIVRMDSGEAVTHTAGAVIAHRHDLRSTLLGHVPAASRMAGVRVRSVRAVGDRAVVSHDGGELTADLVIGADGVHSVVRAFVSPAEPRYAGHTAWRMVLPRPKSVDGTASWAETWGPNAVFGMFPMSGNRVYCYGTGAVEPGQHSPDGELAELRRRFAGWCEPIPAVLAAATEELVLRNDIHLLPPLGTYVRGPVALLGDAAHAMVPYLGQGGCQALEDAATLCVAVETQPDLATALRRYDELRRPRTRAMARKSSQSGFVGHLSWAPARVARNALLRAMPTSMFVRSLARPFSWRPEDGLVEVTPIRPAV